MSKIYEALRLKQSAPVTQVQELPASEQRPGSSAVNGSWKEQYYPKFTDYQIDQFLDYLLSLYVPGTTTSYGIMPVSHSMASAEIVLETFMHLCANRDGHKLLADLSTNQLMLQQLLDNHAFDRAYSGSEPGAVCSVLQRLFHFLSDDGKTMPARRGPTLHRPDTVQLIESYDISLFLLPDVAKFNINIVELVRQMDNIVLLCPENSDLELGKVSRFFKKLGVELKGVYLFGQ